MFEHNVDYLDEYGDSDYDGSYTDDMELLNETRRAESVTTAGTTKMPTWPAQRRSQAINHKYYSFSNYYEVQLVS